MERDCLRRASIVKIKKCGMMNRDTIQFNSIENGVKYGEDDSDTFTNNALNIADRCRR